MKHGALINQSLCTRVATERRQDHLEFETLVADLSSKLINLPPNEVDGVIEDALASVCEPLGIELAVLWQWSDSVPNIIAPTHAYCAFENSQPFDPLKQECFPWVVQEMLAGRRVAFASLGELPVEAAIDREYGRLSGIKSNLTLPLSAGGHAPIGALALNTLQAERDWPDTLVQRLQLIAQLFTSTLLRQRQNRSLLQIESRLLAGVELAGLGFYEADFVKQTARFDDRMRSLCALPAEREQGLGAEEFWMEHLHPDDRERVLDLRQRLYDGKVEDFSVDYRYLHPIRGKIGFSTWLASPRAMPADAPSTRMALPAT